MVTKDTATKKIKTPAMSTSSRGGKKKATAKTKVSKAPPVSTKASRGGKKKEVTQKLRIKVRAYEHKILDASVKQIIDTATRFDATILGPVPLPTEMKKYTVNRSSFIFKDAREQFEMRVHKRLIDILNPSSKVIEALTNLNLPSGVNIDVKMI